MVHLIFGAVTVGGFFLLFDFSRKRRLQVAWWQWLITGLAFLYVVFVCEMVVSFLQEGAAKAALVMGLIFGFIGLVWLVLLGRFIFFKNQEKRTEGSEEEMEVG